MIFGVKSKIPSDMKLTNGYSLFDWIMRKKDVPEFWMRNITGENRITPDELAFLKNKGCRVALLIDGIPEAEAASNNAAARAFETLDALRKLKVPSFSGKAVFVRFGDDEFMNHNWMISFAAILSEYGYLAGFIGNTDSSLNFCFDRECGHFYNATKQIGCYGALYGATEPDCNAPENGWKPYFPSDFSADDISLWESREVIQCGEAELASPVYARDLSVLDSFI